MGDGVTLNVSAITNEAHSYMQACQDRIPKAINDGIYKESFRLRQVAKEGIESEAPGGKSFAPHARFTRLTGKNKTPLLKFAKVMRYKVDRSGEVFSGEIGFLGDVDRWAMKHATGYQIPLTIQHRRWMAVQLRKWGIPPAKGKGINLVVPAREVIPPVFDTEKDKIYENIKEKALSAAQIGGRW